MGENGYIKISSPGDFKHFADSIPDTYGRISSFFEDLNHNVWVCSRGGLLKIKNIEFTGFKTISHTPLDGIYNIIPLPGKKLIFSSGSKTGLMLYDSNAYQHILPPKFSDNTYYYRDPVDAYTFDENNTAWMTTRLWKFYHFNSNTLEDHSGIIPHKTTEIIYDVDYIKSRKQFFICADSTLIYGNRFKLQTLYPEIPECR